MLSRLSYSLHYVMLSEYRQLRAKWPPLTAMTEICRRIHWLEIVLEGSRWTSMQAKARDELAWWQIELTHWASRTANDDDLARYWRTGHLQPAATWEVTCFRVGRSSWVLAPCPTVACAIKHGMEAVRVTNADRFCIRNTRTGFVSETIGWEDTVHTVTAKIEMVS